MKRNLSPFTPARLVAALALAFVACATAEAQTSRFRDPPRFAEQPAGREYRYGGRRYTAELAEDLRRQANSICNELDRNYRDNRGYRQVYRDAYQLITDARHIQEMIRDGYLKKVTGRPDNDDHIANDLHDMDRLFHSVESEIRDWSPDRRGSSRGDRQAMNRLLMNYETTLHNLMQDYGINTRRHEDAHDHGSDRDRDRDRDRRDNGPNRR